MTEKQLLPSSRQAHLLSDSRSPTLSTAADAEAAPVEDAARIPAEGQVDAVVGVLQQLESEMRRGFAAPPSPVARRRPAPATSCGGQ